VGYKRILFLITLLIFCCNKSGEIRPIEKTKLKMGTFFKIVVYDNDKPQKQVEQAIDEAFQVITELEFIADYLNDSSTVSNINRSAAGKFVEADSQLIDMLNESQRIAAMTDGAFDITIAPVMDLWKFHNNSQPQIPAEPELQSALKLVDYRALEIKDFMVKFDRPGMSIDLGGIGKGYAVDYAMKVLIRHGIKDALVNAGGNLKAICSKLTAGKRKIWIKHPRFPEKFYGYFYMDDGSVSTSGDYEQYFIVDSVRYHHILNPKTGYPANQCVSVTITCPGGMTSDVLSTAAFVLGPEKGMQLIEKLEDVEGVIIFEQNHQLHHIVSSGLRDKLILN
jgi:FAD:protein FMN transferase